MTTPQTALVTGASGGIGLEIAKRLAADGHQLVLVARRGQALAEIAEQLRSVAGREVRVVAKDLARFNAGSELADELDAAGVTIDLLVNNAGFGAVGAFAEMAWQEEQDMMQLNMVALTELTRRLLPGMIERRRGRVLNVASTAAFQPGPGMAVYFATKAYVLSLSEALAFELRGTGVTVTALCPGATHTGFAARASAENTGLFKSGAMSAVDVARIGCDGMYRGQAVSIAGWQNAILANAGRFVPRSLVTRIAALMMRSH